MLIERHPVSRPLVIGGGNLSQAVLASLSWRGLLKSAVAVLTVLAFVRRGAA
jgi:hypothetical protein